MNGRPKGRWLGFKVYLLERVGAITKETPLTKPYQVRAAAEHWRDIALKTEYRDKELFVREVVVGQDR